VTPNNRGRAVRSHALLGTMSIIFLVPLVSLFLAALQPSGTFVRGFSIPKSWNWGNFTEAWSGAGLGTFFRSSVIVAIAVVPLSVVLATLAGYGLAMLRPPGSRPLRGLFLLGLAIPVEVIVIPLHFMLKDSTLNDTYTSVILAETALFMPFGTLWMMTNFEALPRELSESARIDGASPVAALRRILLPLSWPSIGTLAALIFMWSWNQFLLVLVLIQDPEKRTVPSGLSRFVGEYSTNVQQLSAATLMAIAPILVVYIAFQRTFVTGMLQGTLK
jgi:ABC-type glycerol-3-phosphate transport system permease component